MNKPIEIAFRRRVALASPPFVIAIGYLAARLSESVLGVWAWVPVTLVYWTSMAFLIGWAGGREAIRRWLRPSTGAWGWRVLALVFAAIAIPTIFLANVRSLNQPWIVILWLLIALVNPWLEEGYWRGLLMDAPKGWPAWLVILYSTLWFGLSHPIVLGVIVPELRGLPGFLGTALSGVLFSIVYWKTGSLRWPIFGHFLADLFNVTILVFLHLAVLPGAEKGHFGMGEKDMNLSLVWAASPPKPTIKLSYTVSR